MKCVVCKKEHDGPKIMCKECIERHRDDMYEYLNGGDNDGVET